MVARPKRRSKPPAERREHVVAVRLNAKEFGALKTAAGLTPPGIWARAMVLEAVERARTKGRKRR